MLHHDNFQNRERSFVGGPSGGPNQIADLQILQLDRSGVVESSLAGSDADDLRVGLDCRF